jgi:hypothetical protein
MFAESFSMVVGVAVDGGDETVVDMTVALGDEGVDVDDTGTNELELEGVVLADWAGPITCCKYKNLGVS